MRILKGIIDDFFYNFLIIFGVFQKGVEEKKIRILARKFSHPSNLVPFNTFGTIIVGIFKTSSFSQVHQP